MNNIPEIMGWVGLGLVILGWALIWTKKITTNDPQYLWGDVVACGLLFVSAIDNIGTMWTNIVATLMLVVWLWSILSVCEYYTGSHD